MVTLAIDISTPRGSVALGSREVTFERPVGRAAPSPPQDLFSALGALRAARPTGECFDQIVVGVGPGSFTGIRAGIAAAKGLALPGRLPVLAACSFDAIARAALPAMPRDCPQLCVLADARRDEVYFALYDREGRRTSDVRLGALEEIELHNPVWFVSSEIEKYREPLRESFGGFATICEPPVFPRASLLRPERLPLEPIYLRAAQYKMM